jgi:hypothetical protein
MRDGDHRGKARPVSAPRPIKDARDEQPPRQPTRDKVAPIVTEPIGPEVRARFLGEGLKAALKMTSYETGLIGVPSVRLAMAWMVRTWVMACPSQRTGSRSMRCR